MGYCIMVLWLMGSAPDHAVAACSVLRSPFLAAHAFTTVASDARCTCVTPSGRLSSLVFVDKCWVTALLSL